MERKQLLYSKMVQAESESLYSRFCRDPQSNRLKGKYPRHIFGYNERKPMDVDYFKSKITNWKDYLILAEKSFEKRYQHYEPPPMNLENIKFIKTIGMGRCSKIMMVLKEGSSELSAMKVISKKKLEALNLEKKLKDEMKIIGVLRFPFIINLEGYLDRGNHLYYLFPLLAGGDFFQFLKNHPNVGISAVRFYAGQLILAIEYLHNLNLLYRNLGLESIMIDHEGYLKLTDFSQCKMVLDRTYTICGIPEYFSPEMVRNQGYGMSADWWAIGVLIYEIDTGKTPFYNEELSIIYLNIITGSANYYSITSKSLRDLLTNMFRPDITRRFGNMRNGVDDIKNHSWFGDQEWWLAIANRAVEPPVVPSRDEQMTYYYSDYVAEKLDKEQGSRQNNSATFVDF